MRKIIVVSMFMIALLMPQIISTGAYALASHSGNDRRDGQYDDRRGDRSDDDRRYRDKSRETVQPSSEEENEETPTNVVENEETTTTTLGSNEGEPEDEVPTTTIPKENVSCINAEWKDNGKTTMDIPEKEFTFESSCKMDGDQQTTVLAYFFYGYDYKTIEKYKETTTTIIIRSPFNTSTEATTPTTVALKPFPALSNQNPSVSPGTQEVAMGDVEESGDNSSSFSIPIILTSIGSIIIYGVKKRLLLPF